MRVYLEGRFKERPMTQAEKDYQRIVDDHLLAKDPEKLHGWAHYEWYSAKWRRERAEKEAAEQPKDKESPCKA